MQALNVWHIDDEDVFRRLFGIFCRRQQLPVVIRSFDNALNAIDLILEQKGESLPDLVVLDLRMPGFDGFDFLKSLNAASLSPAVPVFILSSSTDVRDIIEAHALGASSYFMKDEVEDLLAQIRSMCGPELQTAVGH